MKLSFDWLSDFVDLSGLSASELADKLTMGAFEVEEIECVGPDIEGPVLVGEILDIQSHPDADKIRLTKIRLSEGAEPQEIVCGAWNIEVGHKIPVALPGAKVINRKDGSPLPIKQSKIRGVVSNGMLCSAPELGLSGSGEGIMILDPSAKIGLDAKDLLGIRNDYVLHVEPRSNRGDALSVLGMAREVAALFARPLKKQLWLEEFDAFEESELEAIQVSIENLEDCPYFTARLLSNIKIGASIPQISRRLEAVGIKCINNLVDISNYVRHELGQPLHTYDLAQLKGNILAVRRARQDESILTLDQKERKLNEEALVIADAESVVGVAGVMGGKLSEVSDSTTEIALEAAAFASARVRRSSRLLGLSSDSSLRFERGVDAAQVHQSSNLAAYLAVKHYAAKLGKISKAGSDQVKEIKVQLRMSELKRICEIEMSTDSAAEILAPLGFGRVKGSAGENAVEFLIPSFRQKDVYREIDLVEEVCRLYGYDKIPVSMPASTVAAQNPKRLPARIRRSLSGSGLNEAWLSSLSSYDDLDAKQSFEHNRDTTIGVMNPLSAEHQVLRQSLLPGLIKAAAYNADHGNSKAWLFEIGKIYRKDSKRFNKQIPAHKQTSTHEELMVSAIAASEPSLSQWSDKNSPDLEARSYFLIKGIFENLAASLDIPVQQLRYLKNDEIPGWFHPGRSAACYLDSTEAESAPDKNGNKGKNKNAKKAVLLGFIGEIHPAVADTYGLSSKAAIMELSMTALEQSSSEKLFKDIYTTPSLQRDLTADLDNAISHQDVLEAIRSCNEATLQRVELVSIFQLSESSKSLSYRMTFQDPAQTLKTEAIDAQMQKFRETLSARLGAKFRL
ncbi:MAG: phenylalanine--tRNA ligase subunit beta [Candidatus Obscuribacterales bacterium]|nr:phenylalanine--tRNA ligase subunit beta [Candidatus Obscuribacterales bacterium]